MPKKHVQAVDENYTPPPKQPMSVSEASASGSRLDELIAMRVILSRAIDNPNTLARDLAALTRRQIEVSREVEELKIQEAEDMGGRSNDASDAEWRPQAI